MVNDTVSGTSSGCPVQYAVKGTMVSCKSESAQGNAQD